jgi:hypothetical protein
VSLKVDLVRSFAPAAAGDNALATLTLENKRSGLGDAMRRPTACSSPDGDAIEPHAISLTFDSEAPVK